MNTALIQQPPPETSAFIHNRIGKSFSIFYFCTTVAHRRPCCKLFSLIHCTIRSRSRISPSWWCCSIPGESASTWKSTATWRTSTMVGLSDDGTVFPNVWRPSHLVCGRIWWHFLLASAVTNQSVYDFISEAFGFFSLLLICLRCIFSSHQVSRLLTLPSSERSAPWFCSALCWYSASIRYVYITAYGIERMIVLLGFRFGYRRIIYIVPLHV